MGGSGGGVGGMHPSPNVPPPCIGSSVDMSSGGCCSGPSVAVGESCILEDGHQAVVCHCGDGQESEVRTCLYIYCILSTGVFLLFTTKYSGLCSEQNKGI